MAKPSSITTWATDPGATADPGATRKATGFIAGKRLPAKWLNWILNQNAGWLTYLRDLDVEPEFLNKTYSWTGAHGFAQSIGAFNDVVFGPGSDPLYGTSLGVLTTRTRDVFLLPNAFTAPSLSFDAQWVYVTDPTGLPADFVPGWMSRAGTNNTLIGHFHVPTGARLLAVSAYVVISGTLTVTMSTGYMYASGGLPGSAAQSSPSAVRTTTGVATHTIVDGGVLAPDMNTDHDSAARWKTVTFTPDSGGLGAVACVKWVKLTFADPGPRNF